MIVTQECLGEYELVTQIGAGAWSLLATKLPSGLTRMMIVNEGRKRIPASVFKPLRWAHEAHFESLCAKGLQMAPPFEADVNGGLIPPGVISADLIWVDVANFPLWLVLMEALFALAQSNEDEYIRL